MKIWALFSVENNYDQPENNLVAWWGEKPDFVTLAQVAGFGDFPCSTDEGTLFIVNLWQGKDQQFRTGASYRLQEIQDGKL